MSNPIASPHAHGARPVPQVMLLVMIALTPATLAGFWQFGWPALYLWAVTIGACLLFEAVCARLSQREVRPMLLDGSALLTGWLLAMSLPPWAPWWIGVVGAAAAIVVAKQVFGGLGQNLFNPAMVARVVLLISFPLEMTTWLAPAPIGSAEAPGLLDALTITFAGGSPDAVTSATLLDLAKTELARGTPLSQSLAEHFSPIHSALGMSSGSAGETSALLLFAGGMFLVFTRVIRATIPFAFLLGIAVPAALGHLVSPDTFLSPSVHLLSGAVMLAAFFIATDYVTSPSTPLGQWIFGIGCGLLTWIIRSFGAYPEGVAFAILLMNAATPLIDSYTRPRIFGRQRNGRSITPPPPPAAPKPAAPQVSGAAKEAA